MITMQSNNPNNQASLFTSCQIRTFLPSFYFVIKRCILHNRYLTHIFSPGDFIIPQYYLTYRHCVVNKYIYFSLFTCIQKRKSISKKLLQEYEIVKNWILFKKYIICNNYDFYNSTPPFIDI